MSATALSASLPPDLSFLAGGGEMGERIRAMDWGHTPLGPPDGWRPGLKAMVRMALTTQHPIFIFWGPQSIGLYNDAYRASLGPEKHPSILGIPARQAWVEIWPVIGPQIDMVMRGGGATWHENQLVPIYRHGGLEDVYWTYSYGPIDEPTAPNGVGGVLVICTETTRQVMAEQRKDEFLAMLAHELRNPLAPIVTASHLLSRTDLTRERIVECGLLVKRQSSIIALLLDDLLDISRITSGKLMLIKARVQARVMVDSALEAVRPLLESKHHKLRVTVPEEPLYLDADPLRLPQILINLLTNAAKYTDPGGEIGLDVYASGGHVHFDVSDNGIGLTPEHREQLFQMFYQVQSGTERSQGGLGIGLALTRGLVELHDGTITAHSGGPGLGSTFRVSLPAPAGLAAAPVEGAAVPAVQTTRTREHRVLVVDDNIDVARTLEMSLDLDGYDVRLAHSGEDALLTAAQFQPHAVFLDIGMPGMNGYEVAGRLRAEDWGRNVLLVATTGWGQTEDKRKALAAGFDLHMTKPISPDTVAKLLAERLKGHRH